MSWVRKRGQSPNPTPSVQMYNPNQHHSTQDNQWPKSDQQQNWQQPAYNQQFQDQNYYQQQQNYTNYQQYNQNVQNTHQQPLSAPAPAPPPQENDWNDWAGWGDDDNSNTTQSNNIADSFLITNNDQSWNWNKEVKQENPPQNELLLKVGATKVENKRSEITPQWSIESQMSQASSDDILNTSESDKILSGRSSTKSHSSGQDLAAIGDTKIKNNENREIVTNAPPLHNLLATDDINPYKRNTVLSYKNPNLYHKQNMSQSEDFLTQPFNQSVNLETLPDNSEQPDTLQTSVGNLTQKHWPENNELPSINDRNQYLETGQLSSNDFNQSITNDNDYLNDNDTFPPPGLRRMVLGQQLEQNETILNNSDEQPPPGLSRMIPGQIEISPNSSPATDTRQTFHPIESVEDNLFHRMIPGESSPPEAVPQQQQQEDSEPELSEINKTNQPRSATIGADTPPTMNIIRPENSQDNIRKKGQQNDRRDSIEGENKLEQDGKLDNEEELSSNNNNINNSNNTERNKHKKQDSSDDSEPRRRYRDNKEEKGRYSPTTDDYYRHRDKKHYDKRKHNKRYNEDDTDYYNSDKERENRRRKDEYDRKYNSLRRDVKEKERKRRDYDPRKNYYDNYENESRSRASSRSDSLHDSYRDNRTGGHDHRDRRYREKERDRHRQRHHHRDAFAGYPQGYNYDMYSHYQYQYYENLRKTNPQAYAQLYRNYYQTDLPANYGSGGVEDRASVHSGRSSANDELSKDRCTRQSYYSQSSLQTGGYYRDISHSISGHYGLDDSSSFTRNLDQTDTSINYEDASISKQQEHRYTPAKFTSTHIKASIQSGKLVKIVPNYSQIDGTQNGIVQLTNLEDFLANSTDYLELKRFPGPLMKGVTHKKTIIEYCECKIKEAVCSNNSDLNNDECDSYILMWELLTLLLRQNGMVVGTDIAELLLKNRNLDQKQSIHRSSSTISSVNSGGGGEVIENENQLKEEEITNKFREYLLYGSCKEALEWAMKYGLWGHALFLASKLDKRTYANVMMRFANGLTINDPLQTLYQLLSGKIPAAVTCVADEKWGDWKPHLAMILSNSTQRPELNFKAITQLGDTLMNRGNLYAAQFCYLMAQIDFSNFNDRSSGAKLILLGTNHWHLPFMQYATNESIHMTEIYEYACTLNDDNFTITEFQYFKYLLSTRLADMGLLERSLAYLERISTCIIKHSRDFKSELINKVINLADRLKYYDPIGYGDEEDENVDNRPDNSWLKQLRSIQNDFNISSVTEEISNIGLTNVENDNNQSLQQQTFGNNQENWHQQQQYQPTVDRQIEQDQHQRGDFTTMQSYQEQQRQQFWPNQQQPWPVESNATFIPDSVDRQQYYGAVAQTEPDEKNEKILSPSSAEEIQQPQISMPNQIKEKTIYDKENDNLSKVTTTKKQGSKVKPDEIKANKQDNRWFGGIFSKLSLKPKNQMKLPDDKNPSIVWDQEKKRWINTDEDSADSTNEIKPPPKMTEFVPKPQMAFPTNSMPEINGNLTKPPIPPQSNMFKLQKSRNLKKSYIDVFNPNAKAGPNLEQTNLQSQQMQQPSQFNFFVPQPINDPNAPTDFLTPAPPLQYDENSQQLSRWSSASSLSREVQSYTINHKSHPRKAF